MLRRWRMIAALVAVLALVAAACGDDEGGDETTTTTTTAETTTTTAAETTTTTAAETTTTTGAAGPDLVIWADNTRTPIFQGFAEDFGAQEGLTVEVVEVDFQDIRDRLQVAGPAGEGPDIIVGAHDFVGQLASSGVIAPVDLGGLEAEFAESAIQGFTFDGETWGLPYAIEGIALIRNTDLVPEPPATFEELEETGLALVASGDADIPLAIQQGPGDPFHNYPLFTAMGGYVFGIDDQGNYDPQDVGIDSEGGLAAADKFGEWTDSGLISGDLTYDNMIEFFGTGRAPFAITGPWAIAQEDTGFKAMGVPYVVEPIPPIEGGTPRPFVGVQGLMISAFANNPLAAEAFVLDYMSTEENQLRLFEEGARPPAHLSALEQAAADPDIQGFGESVSVGQPMPAIPEMGSVWQAWTDGYSLIFTGGAEPQEAFTQAAEQIRNLIATGG